MRNYEFSDIPTYKHIKQFSINKSCTPKEALHLCGLHKESLDIGSLLIVVNLDDGGHNPVSDSFIEGNHLL
jgi:hypothetical protein